MNHENSIHVELGNDILKSKTLFKENDFKFQFRRSNCYGYFSHKQYYAGQ